MSAGHAENEHFTYDVTSKLKTKFLGNSLDVYPVGRYGLHFLADSHCKLACMHFYWNTRMETE